MIFVFYLSLRQGCFALCAPVYRLEAPVNIAVFRQFIKTRDYGLFVFRFQGQVWIIPIAENPQPFEFNLLDADVFNRKLMRQFPEFHLVHVVLCLFHLLEKLVFYRHAVAIPSRHIRRVVPLHGFEFNDDVLQGFIQRVAYVDIAVSVRRAVVEYILRLTLLFCAYRLIKIRIFPFFKDAGLFVRQIAFHRKISFRKIQSIFVFHSLIYLVNLSGYPIG